jgi:uncharacterized protein with HEPN domain
VKDDRVYIGHILRCISRIEEYTVEGRDRFFSSYLIQDGVLRNLQVMAESTQRVSDSLRSQHPEVGWKALAGFRNVLVHDYLGVDLESVWSRSVSRTFAANSHRFSRHDRPLRPMRGPAHRGNSARS